MALHSLDARYRQVLHRTICARCAHALVGSSPKPRINPSSAPTRCGWSTGVGTAGSADVQASFVPVAKHYVAIVVPCHPPGGIAKGAVECRVKFMCGRWRRTMTATTPEESQVSLERFCATTGTPFAPPDRYADPGVQVDGVRPVWNTVGEMGIQSATAVKPDWT